MTNPPLTPPPELVQQWDNEAATAEMPDQLYIATQAARWGSDQELEACCLWLGAGRRENLSQVISLRAARRPKPPSLKEQALADLDTLVGRGRSSDTIRRALEALPDD